MSETFNISSISSVKTLRLTSKTEVSLESIAPQEEMAFSKTEGVQAEMQKIEEGLQLMNEIRDQLEAAYFSGSYFPSQIGSKVD